MAHSMSSFAAMESSTLLTSLVKLPSTCLLLSNAVAAAAALLCVSDLSTYTAARCHVRARACLCKRRSRCRHQAGFLFFFVSFDWCLIGSLEVICHSFIRSFIHVDCFLFQLPPRRDVLFYFSLGSNHLTQSSLA